MSSQTINTANNKLLKSWPEPVSYTHLDVYKGQESILSDGADSESRTAAASTR
ncbi:hypothetical protein [Erwinia amylovora]